MSSKCAAFRRVQPTVRVSDGFPVRALAPQMNVLSVTLLVSLCLTCLFVAAYCYEHLRRRETGPEHDSLLPLDDTGVTRHSASSHHEPESSPEDHH